MLDQTQLVQSPQYLPDFIDKPLIVMELEKIGYVRRQFREGRWMVNDSHQEFAGKNIEQVRVTGEGIEYDVFPFPAPPAQLVRAAGRPRYLVKNSGGQSETLAGRQYA